MVTRERILREIRDTLGVVPEWLESLPDTVLESEWGTFKGLLIGDTEIPSKYKQLISAAVSAVLRCRYCTAFHMEAAKMNGASEDEIKEAVLVAKTIAGYSTYLNGMKFDFDRFQRELGEIACHISKEPVAV